MKCEDCGTEEEPLLFDEDGICLCSDCFFEQTCEQLYPLFGEPK